MIFSRKAIPLLIMLGLSVCLLQSCFPKNKLLGVFNRTSVKNPPKNTPFIFDNEIRIEDGTVSKDEARRLEDELSSYWDDTIKAKTIQQWGFFYRLKSPQAFDTSGLDRSAIFMNSFLQSQGYYNAVLRDTFLIDTFRFGRKSQQLRVVPQMFIHPGKRLHFDSIAYNFVDTANAPSDSTLQKLASENMGGTYLKKNDPYSKQAVALELDRLLRHFRDSGYYRLNRDNLVGWVDTTDQLIDSLIIDPFELARVTAEAAERRRQRPTADITIMQATQVKTIPFDSSVLTRYYIGKIFYYPETDATVDIPDTLLKRNTFKVRGGARSNIYMKYKQEPSIFRMRPLIRHTYMTKGNYYSDKSFFRTMNTLSQMGAWQQVEWRDSVRGDTIDFHIFLSPAKKKNIKTDLELTRSTADFASSNNLFGIGGNVTYLNRNFRRGAIQWSSFLRGGVELNLEAKEKLLQTIQFGGGTSFSIPHLWWPFRKMETKSDGARTVINLNANYTDRKDFFRVRSLVANVTSEYRRNYDRFTEGFTFRFPYPNIEIYSLDTLLQLQDQFKLNPFLRTAFNTGTVISWIITYNKTGGSIKNPNFSYTRRLGFEWAGLGLPVLVPHLEDNVYHYLKAEGEYTMKWQYARKAYVLRGLVGAGYNLIADATLGKTLPFFKQFVAGGPNSMRAWGLRQLGLGSSLLSDTATSFSDRFGDFQIEFNGEWRFQVADVGGVKFNSAVFMDVGNIWNLKVDPANPKAQLKLKNIPNDLAVAMGIGLIRLNVANFVLRVDFAFKIKDPARSEAEWLFKKFTWRNQNGNSNYAFQIGIGLPF